MMDTGPAVRQDDQVDRQLEGIRKLLASRWAVGILEIQLLIPAGADKAKDLIERLVELGEVERLRPIFRGDAEGDYFRIRRPDDGSYLWEQQVLGRGPFSQPPTPIRLASLRMAAAL